MARSGFSRGFPCQILVRPSARCRWSPRTSLARSASAIANTLDAATRERTMAGGARERTAGAGRIRGLAQAFLAGEKVTYSVAKRGAAKKQPGLPRPADAYH